MADYITRVFQCFVARVSTSHRKHSLHLFITSSLKDFGNPRLLSPVTCLCSTEAAVLQSAVDSNLLVAEFSSASSEYDRETLCDSDVNFVC